MQGPLRLSLLVVVSFGLLTACGKKSEEPQAGTESVPPAEESAAATAPGAPAETAGGASEPASPAGSSRPPQTRTPTVPAALAASDAAYNAWFELYKLDLQDPEMLDADPDGDGVSNRDEFLADTNPRDPKSVVKQTEVATTDVHPQIRMQEFNELRLPVVLESVEGDTARLKRLDNGKTEMVKAGQTVPDLGLKVDRVQSRRVTDKHGEVFDGSRVILEDPATSQKTTLVKDMPTRSAASYAILRSEDGTTIKNVRQGDTFSWPGEEGATYQVIDLRPDQAVIQHVESGRMLTVPKR